MSTLKTRKKILKLSEIKPYPYNAKMHTPEQIKRLKKSIEENEYLQPILVDKNNIIISGHGRYYAIKEMGEDHKIEVIDGSHLTPMQAKKFRILDNKIISNDWDNEILKTEIESIYKSFDDIDQIAEELQINIDNLGLKQKIKDYNEIDEEFNNLDGMNDYKINIIIPVKYKDQVLEFLANGESITPMAMGRGVLKRCGLL